jgi:DHA2 family multidrug resistance protein
MNSENFTAESGRWWIVLAVMLAAIIEVLDMTIVNVAMPQMMGSLQADQDQITWILTSYIVSSAIVMLLTGFLVTRLGQKRLLLINIIGFLITSVLCGLSQNLLQIVICRTLQGIFGASLIPLSQLILRNTFRQEEQGMAMAIWGTGIMVAPVLGPVLGGYITEYLNWRWVFYINVPVCLYSIFLTLRVIKETPRSKPKIDWLGLLFMIVGIGSLQLFLDRGNTEGWLQSNQIKFLITICVISLSLFIYRGLTQKNPIVNIRIFRHWSFLAPTIMFVVFGVGIFGTLALQPLMLEDLLQYPIIATGVLMVPRGIFSAIFMFIAGALVSKRVDARIFITLGIIISAYGAWLVSRFPLAVDYDHFIWPTILQGAGMGLFFVPLSAMAMSALPPEEVAEATGLFSFGRNLGSSIGISVLGTVLTRETQINWNTLSGHLAQTNRNLNLWLAHSGKTLSDPNTMKQLTFTLANQAQMMAYVDAFWFVAVSFIIMLPLVLTLKPITYQAGGTATALH